jgi:Immunity protein 53
MSSSEIITWLESFYTSQCNGDWEHQSGISINTIDNPGWSVTIDLEGTVLEKVTFQRVKTEKNEHDWVTCWYQDGSWQGRGGPRNLQEILEIFRLWAEAFTTVTP